MRPWMISRPLYFFTSSVVKSPSDLGCHYFSVLVSKPDFDDTACTAVTVQRHSPSSSRALLAYLTLSPPIPLRLYTSPYWSNPPFSMFDIRGHWRCRTERQCARMSKIKNGGLDQYGAEPFEQQQFEAAGVEGVKVYRQSEKMNVRVYAGVLVRSVTMHSSCSRA